MARIRSIKPETPERRWSRTELATFGTALYRAWSPRGDLLYVGVTGNPIERWRRHAQRAPWWTEVDQLTFEVFSKEHLALAAERHAIATENPVHNRRSVRKGGAH